MADTAKNMGATGNAMLLLGFISGSIRANGGGPPGYRVVDAWPACGEITIKSEATGNTFRVSVIQTGGAD